MIMRLLVCATLAFASTPVFSQTTILSEDFQQGLPATWSVVIADTHTVHPSVIEFAPGWITLQDPQNTADTVLGSTSYFRYAGKANRWFISPPITLGAYGNFLKWEARSHDPSFPDDYKVLISKTDNQLSSFIDTVGLIQEEYEQWTSRTADLSDSALLNQTIYVAFVIESNDKFKLYLDDINVTINDPVGIEEFSVSEIVLYPNPARDQFKVKSDYAIEKVSLFSAAGIEVYSQYESFNEPIDFSGIVPGVYFVHIETSEGVFVKRMVKE